MLYPAELKAHICFRTAFRLLPPKRAGAAQIKSEANADQSHITHTARHTPQYAAAGIRPRRLFQPDAPAAAGGGFYALDASPAQGGDSAATRKYCRQSRHRTPHGAKDAAGRPNGRLRAKPGASRTRRLAGAGDGNRTRVPSLEGWCPGRCATPAGTLTNSALES